MNRYLIQKDTQMANKYLKTCSTMSLENGNTSGNYIKIKCHYTSIRMARMKEKTWQYQMLTRLWDMNSH